MKKILLLVHVCILNVYTMEETIKNPSNSELITIICANAEELSLFRKTFEQFKKNSEVLINQFENHSENIIFLEKISKKQLLQLMDLTIEKPLWHDKSFEALSVNISAAESLNISNVFEISCKQFAEKIHTEESLSNNASFENAVKNLSDQAKTSITSYYKQYLQEILSSDWSSANTIKNFNRIYTTSDSIPLTCLSYCPRGKCIIAGKKCLENNLVMVDFVTSKINYFTCAMHAPIIHVVVHDKNYTTLVISTEGIGILEKDGKNNNYMKIPICGIHTLQDRSVECLSMKLDNSKCEQTNCSHHKVTNKEIIIIQKTLQGFAIQKTIELPMQPNELYSCKQVAKCLISFESCSTSKNIKNYDSIVDFNLDKASDTIKISSKDTLCPNNFVQHVSHPAVDNHIAMIIPTKENGALQYTICILEHSLILSGICASIKNLHQLEYMDYFKQPKQVTKKSNCAIM